MKRLMLLTLAIFSLSAFSQDEFEPLDTVYDDQNMVIEEGSIQSELAPLTMDETGFSGEVEREEYFPEGEEHWSLGSEELAAEEFE